MSTGGSEAPVPQVDRGGSRQGLWTGQRTQSVPRTVQICDAASGLTLLTLEQIHCITQHLRVPLT